MNQVLKCFFMMLILMTGGCINITVVSSEDATHQGEGHDAQASVLQTADMAHLHYQGDLEIGNLQERALAYSNRRYVFYDVPDAIEGFRYIRQVGGQEQGYPMTVLRSGFILAAVMAPTPRNDNQIGNKLLMNAGWSPTQWSFHYTDYGPSRLRVWKKFVEADTVEIIPDAKGTWTGVIVIAPVIDTGD